MKQICSLIWRIWCKKHRYCVRCGAMNQAKLLCHECQPNRTLYILNDIHKHAARHATIGDILPSE